MSDVPGAIRSEAAQDRGDGGPPRLVVVTGPPRSGTTFVSDWISEAPAAYCVHEVAAELADLAPETIVERLEAHAASGRDRLDKTLQRTFLDWDEPPVTAAPELLGLKEPVTWDLDGDLDGDGAGSLGFPAWLENLVVASDARVVVLTRHPLDVVASGRRRAVETPNWPGFSTARLCDFWRTTATIATLLEHRGRPRLLLAWENLILRPDAARRDLEGFLDLDLPAFRGRERSDAYLERLARQVSRERGVEGGSSRRLVTTEDRAIVAARLGREMAAHGYTLAGSEQRGNDGDSREP